MQTDWTVYKIIFRININALIYIVFKVVELSSLSSFLFIPFCLLVWLFRFVFETGFLCEPMDVLEVAL